jgi:hypothetical protein
MKAQKSAPPHADQAANAPSMPDLDTDAPVKPTPGLIVLGLVVLLAGLVAGVLMSQATFLR